MSLGTCSWAACHRPGTTEADGWVHCTIHLRAHYAEFPPPAGRPPREPASEADWILAEDLILANLATWTVEQLLAPGRSPQDLSRHRQYVMWLIRLRTKLSLGQIGSLFGGRDHTTVLHAVTVVERRLSEAVAA